MRVGNEAQSCDGYKCSGLRCSMARCTVSGDKHLLDLKQYKSFRIVTAREFYEENIYKIT